MKDWLWHPFGGLLRICWLTILLIMATEKILGQSKNPRCRSIADAIRHLFGMLLGVAGAGPLLIRFLQQLYVLSKDHDYVSPKRRARALQLGYPAVKIPVEPERTPPPVSVAPPEVTPVTEPSRPAPRLPPPPTSKKRDRT